MATSQLRIATEGSENKSTAIRLTGQALPAVKAVTFDDLSERSRYVERGGRPNFAGDFRASLCRAFSNVRDGGAVSRR